MKIIKKWWFWVIVVIVISAVSSGGDKDKTVQTSVEPVKTSSSEPAKTPAPEPVKNDEQKPESKPEPKKEDKFIKAGMYKVGKDIPAGEYILYGDGLMAYYQVTKDSSGQLDSIISNDNFSNTRYITVDDGQYLEFKSAKMLSSADAPAQQPKDNKYPSGMYKIGKDIPAGEYKVVAEGMAYVEVSKDSRGTMDSIATNDNFDGEKYITVQDGQYIKVTMAYIVK